MFFLALGQTRVFGSSDLNSSQGYRSLAEGEEVEFDMETDNTGRRKAANVTAPGGGPVQVVHPTFSHHALGQHSSRQKVS